MVVRHAQEMGELHVPVAISVEVVFLATNSIINLSCTYVCMRWSVQFFGGRRGKRSEPIIMTTPISTPNIKKIVWNIGGGAPPGPLSRWNPDTIAIEIEKPQAKATLQNLSLEVKPSPSPPPEMGSDNECHEMNMDDSKNLERYLRNANIRPPEKLCSRLELENCNDLEWDRKLNPYNLAVSYLNQKPGACWESFVSILCELLARRVAKDVSEAHGVNYDKYCQ